MQTRAIFLWSSFLLVFCTAVDSQSAFAKQAKKSKRILPKVVFMEPEGKTKQKKRKTKQKKRKTKQKYNPLFIRVSDPERVKKLQRMTENDAAVLAFRLFDLAQKIQGTKYAYYIALVPGGNHAAQGFRLKTDDGKVENHTKTPFIKLGDRPSNFETTLLHETGHMVLSILSDGKGVPTKQVAPMFHTTAAITDRGTAFNEGFAIHLETLMAHFGTSPKTKNFYRRHTISREGRINPASGYLFPLMDYGNYAQSWARYRGVRDNEFSFVSAVQTPDYYLVQLSKSRDDTKPRNANQLLANEGFNATYFFRLAAEELRNLEHSSIKEVYRPIFQALQKTLKIDGKKVPPYLVRFVQNFGQDDEKIKSRGIALLFHLSHGAFFDVDYREKWRQYHRTAITLDIVKVRQQFADVGKEEKEWVKRCLGDPRILESRVGTVLPVVVEGVKVRLPVALGSKPLELSFDVNTVQPAILKLIPGIEDEEVSQFVAEREKQPFRSLEDFQKRSGISKAVLTKITPPKD